MAYQLLGLFDGGRIRHLEVFAVEDREAAITRFKELSSSKREIMNLAARVGRQVGEAIVRRDWQALRQICASDVLVDDRRRGLQDRWVGIDAVIQNAQDVVRLGVDAFEEETLAVRGNRFSLRRVTLGGPRGFEAAGIFLDEVNGDGLAVSLTVFDVDDLDEAIAELDERYTVGEGAAVSELIRGMADVLSKYSRGDFAGHRALLHDAIRVEDHRLLGTGSYVGADEFVRNNRIHNELIADYKIFVANVLATSGSVALTQMLAVGRNAEGGDVVRDPIGLWTFTEGLLTAFEYFSPDQLDEAQRRFKELTSTGI